MTTQQFAKGDIVVAVKNSMFGVDHYLVGHQGVVVESGLGKARVQFPNWTGWPYDNSYIRLATPVEAAEYNLKKAQAALDEAQAAEKAEAEAKRKAEEEAKRFTEADVKNLMVVAADREGNDLRLVVIPPETVVEGAQRVRFYDVRGQQCNSCPRDSILCDLNHLYFKTNKTLKDFANEAV